MLLSALLQLTASPVGAKCQPNRQDNTSYYFSGRQRDGIPTLGGVKAWIENQTTWVQPGKFAVAWVGLAASDRWAQVGWQENAYGVRYTFVQIHPGGTSYPTWYYPPQPLNTFSYYTTLFNTSTRVFTFQVNGAQLPVSYQAAWSPTFAMTSGETWGLASQMPGGTLDNQIFWDNRLYYSGAWQPFGGLPYLTHGFYHGQVLGSSTAMQIWDKACYVMKKLASLTLLLAVILVFQQSAGSIDSAPLLLGVSPDELAANGIVLSAPRSSDHPISGDTATEKAGFDAPVKETRLLHVQHGGISRDVWVINYEPSAFPVPGGMPGRTDSGYASLALAFIDADSGEFLFGFSLSDSK